MRSDQQEAPKAQIGRDIERRRDPEDGKAYTFEEFRAAYEKEYLIEDMRKYWKDEMQVVSQASRPVPAAKAAKAPTSLGFDTVLSWLRHVDETGVLLQYCDVMSSLCDGSADIFLEKYAPMNADGKRCLEKGMFDACGIKKVGHKRMLEHWFQALPSEKLSALSAETAQEQTSVPITRASPAAPTTCAVTVAPHVAVSVSREPELPIVGKRFGSVRSWIAGLDESGVLKQYSDAISEACGDSADAIIEKYAPIQHGKRCLSKAFFDSCGIKKVGHKRLFEQWFANVPVAPTCDGDDDVSKVQEQLRDPHARDKAEDLPIDLVEEFYKTPGSKLCEVAASGDLRALAVFLALCSIINIKWAQVRSDAGESIAEAAGAAGHLDLAKAIVREAGCANMPLAAVVAYSDTSAEKVESLIKAGAQPDLYACAAAAQLPEGPRRTQLLALLGDSTTAGNWLSEALAGPSREWVAALRVARAFNVEMRCG